MNFVLTEDSVILVEDNSREIIQSACRSVGSVKDNEFDVRFNPDLFQPHVSLNQTVRSERTRRVGSFVTVSALSVPAFRNSSRYQATQRSG